MTSNNSAHTTETLDSNIAISVVIPLHNALPYFMKTMESLLSQTLSNDAFEVIVVDDGSNDGSEHYADEVAAAHPSLVRVIHLTPSGGPSKPRNVGMKQAHGTFVFFLDSDDFLGPEALERMLAHAHEWECDVLAVKQVGENGRSVPTSMFRFDQPNADVWTSRIFYTLSPLKLFRTSLLRDNNLVFPEQLRYREDEVFTSEALFCAGRVSIAADYDYCHIVARDDGSNLSNESQIDFEKNSEVARLLIAQMRAHLPEPHAGDRAVFPRILKTVWFAAACSAARDETPVRNARFDALAALIGEEPSDALMKHLPPGVDRLVEFIWAHDHERAAACVELLDCAPNGNYASVNLDSGKTAIIDGCLILQSIRGDVAIDITTSIPLDWLIDEVEANERLIFSCSYQPNDYWTADAHCTLIATSRASGKSVVIDAAETHVQPDGRMTFTFTAEESFFGEIASEPKTTWDCFGRIACNGLARTMRFGSHMTPACRNNAPARGTTWRAGIGSVAIRYTAAGNILFRSRKKQRQ